LEELLISDQFQPLAAQFVLLKMEIGSREAGLWNAYHPSSGNGIPQVYIVRADGEELYNRVGGLNSNRLHDVLTDALNRGGNRIEKNDGRVLKKLAGQLKTANRSKNLSAGLLVLQQEKEHVPRLIQCFAQPAAEFRREFERFDQLLRDQIELWGTELADFGNQPVKNQVQTFDLIQTSLPTLLINPIWDLDLSGIKTAIEQSEGYQKLALDNQILEGLENSPETPATELLNELRQRYAKTAWEKRIERVARRVAIISDPSNNGEKSGWTRVDGQDSRQWSSDDGNFSVSAKLIGLAEKAIQLKRDDGAVIAVPLERLSDLDRRWIENLRRDWND